MSAPVKTNKPNGDAYVPVIPEVQNKDVPVIPEVQNKDVPVIPEVQNKDVLAIPEVQNTDVPVTLGIQNKELVPNEIYQHKKILSQGFLDIALLTSNASQLRYLLEEGKKASVFYKPSVMCISISLFLQVLVGIALLIRVRLGKIKDKKMKKEAQNGSKTPNQNEDDSEWIEFFDSFISIGILLILIINVFIAAFSGSMGYANDNHHLVFQYKNQTFLAYNPIFGRSNLTITALTS